jgi:hypothetical protein
MSIRLQRSSTKHIEGNLSGNSGQTQTMTCNEYGHNLVSVTHKVSDHCLHHENCDYLQTLLLTVTHHLPTVAVDNYINNLLK